MINKKAAMFGLDARIALAIFGALSVITGAALYSAISNAKVVSMKTEIQELSKAFEEYYLKKGEYLSICPLASHPSNKARFRTGLLTEFFSGTSSTEVTCSDQGLQAGPNSYQIMLFINDNDLWGDSLGWWGHAECVAGKKCGAYVQYSLKVSKKSFGEKVFQSLDSDFDGGDGKGKGKVRYFIDGGGQTYIHVKIMDMVNPYD